jgi:plasmid maintenance system antidote protein VapI
MTPSRLRDILALLCWSQRGLAGVLGCDERLVRRMATGAADIPAPIAAWLETLAAVHEANPPPSEWRSRAA